MADVINLSGSSDDDKARPKAILSARRAAFSGEHKERAAQRIKKNWPSVRGIASITDEAYEWIRQFHSGRVVDVNGISKQICTLQDINKEFALFIADDNPASIVLKRTASLIPAKDFSTRLSGKVIMTGVKSKGPQFTSAAKVWNETCRKDVYNKVAFTSQPTPDGTLNLFGGFGVAAVQGRCRRILNHIHEVICSGEVMVTSKLLDLIAWQIQNIGKPSRIIVVLVSEQQQTGKGTLLESVLLRIFGRAGFITANISDVIGSFNEVLRGKAYVVLDEALFAGDVRAADAIKQLAATQTISLNAKYLPHVQVPSGINFWVASNHRIPVHVEEKDARYWPLKISDARHGDHDYWQALYAEIDAGGAEAFLYEMLHRDISGFIPQRDTPRRNAVWSEMAKSAMQPADPRRWLEESCECGELLGAEDDNPITFQAGTEIEPKRLIAAYRAWAKPMRGYGIKTVPNDEFWRLLTDHGFQRTTVLGGNQKARRRIMPDPDECLETLNAVFYEHNRKHP